MGFHKCFDWRVGGGFKGFKETRGGLQTMPPLLPINAQEKKRIRSFLLLTNSCLISAMTMSPFWYPSNSTQVEASWINYDRSTMQSCVHSFRILSFCWTFMKTSFWTADYIYRGNILLALLSQEPVYARSLTKKKSCYFSGVTMFQCCIQTLSPVSTDTSIAPITIIVSSRRLQLCVYSMLGLELLDIVDLAQKRHRQGTAWNENWPGIPNLLSRDPLWACSMSTFRLMQTHLHESS